MGVQDLMKRMYESDSEKKKRLEEEKKKKKKPSFLDRKSRIDQAIEDAQK